MDYIPSHLELGRHPKTRRLARVLNISLPTAVGHLHYLWWWATEYAKDGFLSYWPVEDVAEGALWEGDAQAFMAGLIEAGFVDDHDGAHTLHDWDDYVGKEITKNEKDAERKRRERRRQALEAAPERTSGDHPPEEGTPSAGRPQDVPRTSEHIQDLTRQDKENPPTTTRAPVLQFAEVLSTKCDIVLTAHHVALISSKYGDLDLEHEATKLMEWWNNTKPRDRPRLPPNFVIDWLKREKEKRDAGPDAGRARGDPGGDRSKAKNGAAAPSGAGGRRRRPVGDDYSPEERRESARRAGATNYR